VLFRSELGAYKAGISFLNTYNLIDKYDYYVFTQDTFVLKNKYDFNNLRKNNTLACTLVSHSREHINIVCYTHPISVKVLTSLNLQYSIHLLSLCFANSFILHKSKIAEFFNIIKDVVITTKIESIASERFLSGVLYHLNNRIIADIDGDIQYTKYDAFNVNINDDIPSYFVKKIHGKDENTLDV
jgi:hypothetical protein